MYAFAPDNPPGLVERNFCLAILCFFVKDSTLERWLRLFVDLPGHRDHTLIKGILLSGFLQQKAT